MYVLGLNLQGLGLEGFRVFRFRLALRVEAQGEHLPLSEDELPSEVENHFCGSVHNGLYHTHTHRDTERPGKLWPEEVLFGIGTFFLEACSRTIDDRSGAVALLVMETPALDRAARCIEGLQRTSPKPEE